MAGNSQRKNRRKPGTKKGPTVGTGGQQRRSLRGKGPTPPGEMRPGHPKQRQAQQAAQRAAQRTNARRNKGSTKAPSEMVVGRNPVLEALRAEVPAATVHVAQYIDSDERVREALRLATDRQIPLLETPRQEMDRLTGGLYHQGMALQVPPYEYAHPDDLLTAAAGSGRDPLVVALDGVTDPRNLGAVVRSVSAFAGHGVIVPERRSAGMTAAAWKTSAGTAARLPVARATNLTRTLKDYQKAGVMVVGLAADGDADLTELNLLDGPVVVVAGAEGRGLSRLVTETCDVTARIPMPGGGESLNASVAAGVVLYEAARRRGQR